MEIKLTRDYTLKSKLTSAEFIEAVDRMMRMYDNRLDSLDMGDAVSAAVDLFENGEMNPATIEVSYDQEYKYTDCPDSRTLLDYDSETDKYTVDPGTDQPGFRSPYEIARETILQGRQVLTCAPCKDGNRGACTDEEGGYLTWVCSSWLHEVMNDHFAGVGIKIPDIHNYPNMISLKGWVHNG